MLLIDQHSVQPINKKYFIIMLCTCFYQFQMAYSQKIVHLLTPDRPEVLLPCHTPTGKASFCVPLERCEELSSLITNLQKPIPGDVGKYIKESFFCQSSNKVCCHFHSIINPRMTDRPPIRNRGKKC